MCSYHLLRDCSFLVMSSVVLFYPTRKMFSITLKIVALCLILNELTDVSGLTCYGCKYTAGQVLAPGEPDCRHPSKGMGEECDAPADYFVWNATFSFCWTHIMYQNVYQTSDDPPDPLPKIQRVIRRCAYSYSQTVRHPPEDMKKQKMMDYKECANMSQFTIPERIFPGNPHFGSECECDRTYCNSYDIPDEVKPTTTPKPGGKTV